MILLTALLANGAALAADPPAADLPITCSYQSLSQTSTVAPGISLDQGVVTCGTSMLTHNTGVSILTVDMTTPLRRIGTTASPAVKPTPAPNPDNYVGTAFELELPTSYLIPRSPKLKPVGLYRFVPEAVVNANLFTNSPWYTRKSMPFPATWLRGLEISLGKGNVPILGNASRPCEQQTNGQCYSSKFDASLLLHVDGRAEIRQIDDIIGPEILPGVDAAVTGSDMLVKDRRAVAVRCPSTATGCQGEFFGANSRTAVGMIGATTMLVLAVDSTGTGSGLQLDELAAFLVSRNVDAAINLDGGGSTVMAIQTTSGATIVNRPSDGGPTSACDVHVPRGGCERYVGNTLIIGQMESIGAPVPASRGKAMR